MSSIVACSRMTWPVIGTLRPFTTSASRRSTRNCMSTSSSGGGVSVPQKEQRLLADLLHAHEMSAWWWVGRALAKGARDHEPVGRERVAERGVAESRLGDRGVHERRIAKRQIEGTRWSRIEVRDHIRGENRGAPGE